MDYMGLIKRSFGYAWKLKYLWLFGFLVSLGDSGSNGVRIVGDLGETRDLGELGELQGLLDIDPGLFALIIAIAIILALILWLLKVFSEGALIHGIASAELSREAGLGSCWSVAGTKFLRLFGIMLLFTIVVITLVIGLMVFLIPAFLASVGLGVILFLLGLPVFIALILVGVCIEGWSIRYAILYDQPWLDAIKYGWLLFKSNIGRTLGVAFSSFITQLVAGIGVFIVVFILAIPFVIMGMLNLWLGLIPGILTFIVLIVLLSSVFGVFASSVWTLGFMQLTGLTQSLSRRIAPPPISPHHPDNPSPGMMPST